MSSPHGGASPLSAPAHAARGSHPVRRTLRWAVASIAATLIAVGLSLGLSASAAHADVEPSVSANAPGASVATHTTAAPTRPERAVTPQTTPDLTGPAADPSADTPTPTESTTPASPGTSTATGAQGGSTSSSGPLAPLDASDTHGLSIGKYQLSVDTGGVTNGMKLITNGVLLSGIWEAYRWTVGAAVAMIGLALQMEWIDWLVQAVNPVALTLQNDVVGRLGLRGLALSVMGLWVAVLIATGRVGKGLGQLLVSSTIAALAVGVLANPVALITGHDGVLYKSRDAGQAVATVITTDGKSATPDPTSIQDKTGGAMVDTFVRLPHQMINYGKVLDGTSCEKAYDDTLNDGPYDSDDDAARSAVGDCDEKLKDWADDPGWTGVGAVAILAPAGGALVVLAVVLVVLIFLATLMVIFFAVKLIIDIVMAILPGERGGLWGSVAGLGGALLTVAGLMIMLALYCVFLRGVLTTQSGQDMLVRFFIVDAMVISFIVVTFVARKRIRERAQRMAEKAAAFSGGGKAAPAQMPKLSQARQAISQAAATRAAGSRMLGGPGAAAGSGLGASTAGAGAAGGSAAGRVLRRVSQNRLVKTGLTAASLAGGAAGLAAKSTIGLPVYGPRAARVVKAATRTRAAAVRGAVQAKATQGKAFAGEYRDGLAIVGRPAAKVGKAAGRKAAPAVTAASIGLSTPRSGKAGAGKAPASVSVTRSGTRAGASVRRTATAAHQRQAAHREAQRASNPPRSSTGSEAAPGATSRTYRVTRSSPSTTPPAGTRAARDDDGSTARLYARRQLRQASDRTNP